MMERRLEVRCLCSDLIRVHWKDAQNEMQTMEAVLEDICTQGACVQVEEPIPPGVAITMTVLAGGVMRFTGSVSYCLYREYGYFVGIRFSEETRWSSGAFEPRHLTNLQALVAKARVN